MKACVVVPERFTVAATRTLSSSGMRMVVVGMWVSRNGVGPANVAQERYTLEAPHYSIGPTPRSHITG